MVAVRQVRQQVKNKHQRTETGSYLVEVLVAVIIGAILMLATYSTMMASFRTSTTGQNHVLASNIAQQLIDNARDSSYTRLTSILNGGITVSQEVPLYTVPTDQTNALFQRPLLRHPDLNYTVEAGNQIFNGTVTETVTNLTPANTTNGMLQIAINIRWTDANGTHEYSTATTISQNGIHNN